MEVYDLILHKTGMTAKYYKKEHENSRLPERQFIALIVAKK